MHQPIRAYVGIGANVGDPVRQVLAALRALADGLPQTRLLAHSRLYRNPPFGPVPQPDYVNAVAALETRLEAPVLLAALQAIEQTAGRTREGPRWGPRTLDLDLLLFGGECVDEPGLRVPHPGLPDRDFVLFPLLELAPELQIPGLGPLQALCARHSTHNLLVIDEVMVSTPPVDGAGSVESTAAGMGAVGKGPAETGSDGTGSSGTMAFGAGTDRAGSAGTGVDETGATGVVVGVRMVG